MKSTACRSYNISSIFLFFILTFTLSTTWQPANAQGSSEPDLSNILELINEARAEDRMCGDQYFDAVVPLQWSNDLEKAAQIHSDDMAGDGFLSHTGSDGSTPRVRVERITTRYSSYGENVASGQRSAESVMEAWLNSPGHCANIMQPNSTHVAVTVQFSESQQGTSKPYWTMKLAGEAMQEYEEEPTDTVEEITLLDIDQDYVMLQLNRMRERGVQCGGVTGNRISPEQDIYWHEDVVNAAQRRAQSTVGRSSRYITGDRRVFWTSIPGDNFNRGNFIAVKASLDFENALDKWLDDPVTCRSLMRNGITFAGVAAAYETDSDEDQAYWVFLFSSRTPKDMRDEVAAHFRGMDITIYGSTGCGLTQNMHNEFSEFGINHRTAFYDNNRDSNHQRMHNAWRDADQRISGGSTLPYVAVGNTMYTGYYTAAALYHEMLTFETEEERTQARTDAVRSGADEPSRRVERGPGGKTSLTAGYINDEFLILTDQESARFFFDGESAGVMLSSNKAYFMAGYGVADANEDEGEIRSFSADLSFGGNITLFRHILSLPADVYLPVRMNLGYRNLTLTESDDTMQLAKAGLGAGIGGSFRIPLGVPVLSDGLSGFVSVVRSVGGIGDLSGITANHPGMVNLGSEELLSGVRLMQNTDLNIEGKLGRIFGSNTGVTLGLTVRSQAWSEAPAENAWEIIDVALSNRDDLVRRGSQIFFRAGINW